MTSNRSYTHVQKVKSMEKHSSASRIEAPPVQFGWLKRVGIMMGASLLALSYPLGRLTAHAQVGLSPLVIYTEFEQGQAQGVISVRNDSNEPFRARVYAEAFTYDRDTGFQTLPEESPGNLVPYLQFSPRELNVPPATERRIRFIANVPPSIEDREYRAVLFTERLEEVEVVDNNSQLIGVVARVGSTVYAHKGDLTPPSFQAKDAILSAPDNQLQLLVENQGEISARPTANWRLQQAGVELAQGSVPPWGIIGGSERYMPLVLPESMELASGQYQVSGDFVLGEVIVDSFNLEFTVP